MPRVNKYRAVAVANLNDAAELSRAAALALRVERKHGRAPVIAPLLPGFARVYRTDGAQRTRGVAPLTTPSTREAEERTPRVGPDYVAARIRRLTERGMTDLAYRLASDTLTWRIYAPPRTEPPPSALVIDPAAITETEKDRDFAAYLALAARPAPNPTGQRVRLAGTYTRPTLAARIEAYDTAGRETVR